MKKTNKILMIVTTLIACLAMAVGLAACGDKAAEVKDVYVANGTCTGPADDGGPHVIQTTSTNIILYSDDTYMLVVTTNGYMNAYGNSQVMKACTISYGTYTFTVSEDDEEVATLALSKPTRIISNTTITSVGSTYLDTADANTFAESETTAEETLAGGKEYTLTVNVVTKTVTSGLNG